MKSLDKTKKSNIKCEHCKFCYNNPFMVSIISKPYKCELEDKEVNYWNRCKRFEWK